MNDSPIRILISEDDLTSRNILSAILQKNGAEVVETSNGLEALSEMQKPDAPKLLILDWVMPEMDGIETCRRIRKTETTEPAYIIMLTIRDDKSDIVTGLNAGADDYLAKPFDPDELMARIKVGERILQMQRQLTSQVKDLEQALQHIKTLQGILPICSFCKKIRDDKGYWNKLESYISRHSDAEFSHGICPKCMKEHYGEFCDEKE